VARQGSPGALVDSRRIFLRWSLCGTLWHVARAHVRARFSSHHSATLDDGERTMSIDTARAFFLWCSVINYALLIVWALLATIGRGWMYGLAGRVFPLSREQFDLLNYAGITLYKMGTLLFSIVPLIALYIVR
jgi:hypothetical protein